MGDYLFHYTDKRGIDGIEAENRVFPSVSGQSRDAHFGTGVYLTALDPSLSDVELVENNFGTNTPVTQAKLARVQYFVCFEVSALPGVKKVNARDGRDVYVYLTETGINLNTINGTIGNR